MSVERFVTKPKHRNIKVLKSYFGGKIFGIRYVIYNILSKYNIIYKKYNYIDNVVEDTVDLDYFGHCSTKNFKVDLKCCYSSIYHIKEEYFYRDTKFGKKIVLLVEDSHTWTTDFCFYPMDNISINLPNQLEEPNWFLTNSSSPLRVTFLQSDTIRTIYDETDELRKPVCKEKAFDLSKIRSLMFRYSVSCKSDEITEYQLKYIKEVAEKEFSSILDSITIGSLIV